MSRLTDEELFEVYSKAYDAKGDVVREEAVFGYAGLRAVADAAVAADRAGRGEPISLNLSHDKAGGIYPEAKPEMVVPEKLKHTPVTLTEYDTGYIEGWNACCDATQKEPT